ncbi:MAG TPA: hypothetical protein VHV55_26605 [Pirellulales bacterium]|jgi:hypothetical protein|nr:hypothetical protein [Pirellulales bacterium]
MASPAGNRNSKTSAAGQSASAAGQLPVECDRYIEQKLQKTRQQLHAIELAVAVLVLSVGSLAYLALMVLVDHWIMPHGLGFGGRLAALGVFVLAFGGYGLAYVVPLLMRRVNPLYAARAIEQSRPALKNSLINLLLLRGRANELPTVVYEGMQHQAANDLTQVTVESAVDGSRLVKLGYVLAVLVVAFCLYKVLSPKDPLRSIGRVIDPWADLAVPTRVQIDDVQPGDSQQLQERRVRVSALVEGLEPGEPVTIYYSTADGQLVDQPIRMELPDNSYRYAADLPDGGSGLQQDLSYRIVAGDAISRVYQVQALIAPAISVERVDYRYPAYTELPPRTTERQGDLQAIEGTTVTLHAKTTHPIKTAHVRFDDGGSAGVRMSSSGREASYSFTLAIKDGKPEHTAYYLVFTDRQGHSSDDVAPIRYKIEVVADLPPEVAFVQPQLDPKQELSMAESGSLRLTLAASDPDFKLAKLTLEIERNGTPLAIPPLVTDPRAGPVRTAYVLNARSLGLKAGDKVEFWAVAEDNKQSQPEQKPNRTETPKYTLRILSPQQQKKEQDQLAQAKPPEAHRPDQQPPADGQKPDAQPAGQRPQDQPADQQDGGQKKPQQAGEQQPGQQPPGGEQQAGGEQKPGGQQKPDEQRVDPDADPGKAIDEINKHFDQDKPQANPQNDNPQNADEQADDKPSPKQKPDDPNQEESPAGNGPKSSARSQKPGDSGDGRPPDNGGQAGDKGQGAAGETGRSKADQAPAGANDQGKNPDQPESGGQDEKPLGAQRTGQTKPADPQAGGEPGKSDGQPGEPMPGGQNQPGGEQQSGGQGGQPQSGQQPGQPKPGQQSPTGGQPSSGGQQKPDGQPGGQPQSNQQPGSDDKGQQPQSGQPSGKPQPGSKEQGSQQPGKGQQGEGQQQGQPAPKDKPQDGRQPGAQPQADKQPGNQQPSGGDQQQSGGKMGEQPGRDPMGSPQPGASDQGGKDQPGKDPGGKDASGKDPGGKEPSGKPAGDEGKKPGESPGSDNQAGQPTGGQPGQGDKAAGNPGDQKAKDQPTNPQAGGQQDAKGGDPDNGKDQAGAGQPGTDKQGTPSPQESNMSRDKQDDQSGGQQQPMNSGEGSSPSRSPQDSNSKGSVGGDQSGGGEEGGGQKANQSGTGGAGQNTASDDGGGKSNEKGPGETSGKPGDQAQAQKPTPGASGKQPGQGSGQKPGNSKPGGQQQARGGNDQPQNAPQGDASDGTPSGAAQGGGKQQGAGNPGGGGSADQYNGARSPQQPNPAGPEEDPNLDYARKATDLALERLKHQLQKPGSDDLLNKLKWTREDAQRFINRWEAMKQAAKQDNAAGRAAQAQLDESLRSLGLRPHGTSAAGDHYRNQRLRNLRDTARTRPPAEYADQYRAYSTGTSQVRGAEDAAQPPAK